MTWLRWLNAIVVLLLGLQVVHHWQYEVSFGEWARLGMSGVFYVLIRESARYVHGIFEICLDSQKIIIQQHEVRMLVNEQLLEGQQRVEEQAREVEERQDELHRQAADRAAKSLGEKFEHIDRKLDATIDVGTKAADASALASEKAAEVAASIVTKDDLEMRLRELFRTARPERRRDA